MKFYLKAIAAGAAILFTGIPESRSQCNQPPWESCNLMQNGYLDHEVNCPTALESIGSTASASLACGWTNAGAALNADYFHACANLSTTAFPAPNNPATQFGLPFNFYGHQPHHSPSTNGGMAGLKLYDRTAGSINHTAYLQYTIPALTLQSGENYNVDFLQCLAERSAYYADQIGLMVSANKPTFNPDGTAVWPTSGSVHFWPNNLVNPRNVDAWKAISETFVANGDERYITIGRFKDNVFDVNIKREVLGHTINQSQTWPNLPNTPNHSYSMDQEVAYYYIDAVRIRTWDDPTVISYTGDTDCRDTRLDFSAPQVFMCAPAGSIIYTWNFGNGLTSNDPTPKNVPYLAAGSYTVTLTIEDPMGGIIASLDRTIQINAGDCITETNCPSQGSSDLLSSYQNTNTGSPYVFTGKWQTFTDVTLQGPGTFHLTEDCRFYMHKGTSLILTGDAKLIIDGATITAACEDMWDGINVTTKGSGIEARTGPAGRFAEISYSLKGIQMEQEEAGFQLTELNFLNNLKSLTRIAKSFPVQTSGIDDCFFTSYSQTMRRPLEEDTPLHGNKWLSLMHLHLTGEYSPVSITGNYFGPAMFGVYAGSGPRHNGYPATIGFNLRNNLFRGQHVAGVYAFELMEGQQSGNNFRLPAPGVVDAGMPQFQDALTYTQPGFNKSTAGIAGINVVAGTGGAASLINNTFTRSLPAHYQFGSSLIPGYGVFIQEQSLDLALERNSFSNLESGLRFKLHGTQNSRVEGNYFRDNEADLEALENTVQCGGFPCVTPTVLVSCNTFERTGDLVGDSWGILLRSGAEIVIDHPGSTATNPIPMKNHFTGSAQSGQFTHIANDPGNSSAPTLSYLTYISGSATNVSTISTAGNVTLLSTSAAFNINNDRCNQQTPPYSTGINSRLMAGEGNGRLQAASAADGSAAFVNQNVPNPFSNETTIEYGNLQKGQSAVLVVRELVTGREVQRQTLNGVNGKVVLQMGHLSSGLYFYQLAVDGNVAATGKMMLLKE